MSKGNLGSKQKIILRNCLIKNDRYDLVITPQRQTIGYIRSKDKHGKQFQRTNANYQKTIFKTTKRDFQNEHNTGASRFKRFNN